MRTDEPTPEDRELVEMAIGADLLASGLSEDDSPISAPEGYELVRSLGRGGAGEVYLAWEKNLRRNVALKFIINTRPVDMERFRREARFAARLKDTAIVQIYELGEWLGRPYIAMQYIDGGSLGQAQLEPRVVVDIVRTIANALQHAHCQGIIHRDIKPQNILLDKKGRPYLSDFGVARDMTSEFGATLSGDGIIVGTPELMPPEQARGDHRAIDARSDIYSIGSTMYYVLTGRMPFEGENIVDVLHAVIHDIPPFPRSFVTSLPRALETIVLKCMKKEKGERYQSVQHLIEDLDDFLKGTSVRSESSAWFKKLVGVRTKEREPSSDPEIPYWNLALEIGREISAWDANLYRVATNLPKTYPPLLDIIDRLSALLTVHPDLAWARFYRGMARLRVRKLEEALDDMERSIDRAGDLVGSYFELGRLYLTLHLKESLDAHKHISRVGVDHQLSVARGRLDQAVLMFEEAKERHGSIPAWQVDYAGAVSLLAEKDHTGCVVVCDSILEQDSDLEEVWKLRGDALRFAGENPLPSYGRALEVRRSYYDALHAEGEVLFAREEFDEARDAFERVVKIIPGCPEALSWIGRTYLALARREGAVAVAVDDAIAAGLAVAKEALEGNPENFEALVTQAELQIERGRRVDTVAPFDHAMILLERCRLLNGCQNRVKLVTARTLVERAKKDLESERSRTDLMRVIELCRGDQAELPGAEPWLELREVAEEMLERMGGS